MASLEPVPRGVGAAIACGIVACAIVACAVVACGPQPAPRAPVEAEPRVVQEREALDLIVEVLEGASISHSRGWPVDIAAPQPLDVDLRLGTTDYGIEWVSPQDRQDYGDAIPEPDPRGQLRILPGRGEQASAQILVLDFTSFRYEAELERVQGGAPGIREAESRVRRDVRDYLEYVRGQGAL